MMTREEALVELKQRVKNKNLLKHMYACEAVMKSLAERFDGDQDKWALAGLLHDIDYQQTADDPSQHSKVGAQILEELGLPEDVVSTVRAHNDYHGFPRETKMEKALYAIDPLTGLIVAGALIKPEKKLNAIDVNFLMNRFEEKSFAKGANREQIRSCVELDIELEEFISIGLKAMQGISQELGL